MILIRLARQNQIDDVVVALPWNDDQRIVNVVNALDELPMYVRIGPDLVGFRYSERVISSWGGIKLIDAVTQTDGGMEDLY